ncbi:PIN domain-containing protein [Ideonella alba]|uniref:PIN domain-containing protein n=1 Tax=Ideonella alba TaxID=2824118 RepID=UPI0035BFCD6B
MAAAGAHVLLDFENVQPTDAELRDLVPQASQVWVFHGPHQRQVAKRFASFGQHATAVPISKTGKNALDFHLSFYMGYIASRNPEAPMIVVANDKGYEPMLEHAQAMGFVVRRQPFPPITAPAGQPAAKKTAARKRPAGQASAKTSAARKTTAKATPATKTPTAAPVAPAVAPQARTQAARPTRAAPRVAPALAPTPAPAPQPQSAPAPAKRSAATPAAPAKAPKKTPAPKPQPAQAAPAKPAPAKPAPAKPAPAKPAPAKPAPAKPAPAKPAPAKPTAARKAATPRRTNAAAAAPVAPAASPRQAKAPAAQPPSAPRVAVTAQDLQRITDQLLKTGDKRPTRMGRLRGLLKSLLSAQTGDAVIEVAINALVAAGTVAVGPDNAVRYPRFEAGAAAKR